MDSHGRRRRLVVENVPGSVKCQFGGAPAPSRVSPSVVGQPIHSGSQNVGNIRVKDLVAKYEGSHLPRKMDIYPMEDGMAHSWEDLRLVLDPTFRGDRLFSPTMVFATRAMVLSLEEVQDLVSQLEDEEFVMRNLDCLTYFTVKGDVIASSGILPVLHTLSKDWYYGPAASRVFHKLHHTLDNEKTANQKSLHRKSSHEHPQNTVIQKVRTETGARSSPETHSDVSRLAEKLKALPPSPTADDVAKLLPGLTAQLLMEAETLIGKQMNRVQRLWWAVLHRDFGDKVAAGNIDWDVRMIYQWEEEKKQRKSVENRAYEVVTYEKVL